VISGREAIRGTVPEELACFNTERSSRAWELRWRLGGRHPPPTVEEPADVADELPENTLLAARGIGRRYGDHVALAPLDVDIRAGELVAVIGPNGAGKSTLVSIVAGALEPSEGRVVHGSPPARVGWVPQRPAQYARLSARENLELFARLEGLPDPREAATRMLDVVDLPDDGRPAGRLSLGNQQRLNLGIALLADPDVLLLDEPTAALDPSQRSRLWEIATGTRDRGGAVVFVTQNLEELERFADRVIVLRGGELVFDGSHDAYDATPEAHVFA
jgi:ABC-type multidrug transport system ATPase subunit